MDWRIMIWIIIGFIFGSGFMYLILRGIIWDIDRLRSRLSATVSDLIDQELVTYKANLNKMSEALEEAYLNGKRDA